MAESIYDQQIEQGKLYAKLNEYRGHLRFALAGIEAMRKIAPNSYLSLSFGKQSIILAHMLYQVDPSTPMFFLASGESFLIHNFAQVISTFTERWPINLTIVSRDHVFDDLSTSWQESRDAGKGDLQRMCNREDWDGWYWGLAKDESGARHMTLSYRWLGQPHPTIYRYADGRYRCCPIMEWKILDIAAYIATYDIPVLEQYHRLGLQSRTTARITRQAAENGGVDEIKHTDMSAFNRICARFPELRLRT